MFYLIIGGSGSGKSEFAEECCLRLSGNRKLENRKPECKDTYSPRFSENRMSEMEEAYHSEPSESRVPEIEGTCQAKLSGGKKMLYLATMQPFGEEGKKRIARHRKLRSGKGFETLECYTHLENAHIEEGWTVLLECLSNLTANEIFSPDGAVEEYKEKISRNGAEEEKEKFSSVSEEKEHKDKLSSTGTEMEADEIFSLNDRREECMEYCMEYTVSSILKGIDHVIESSENLVVVTNDIFCDGLTYSQETIDYMKCLAKINRELAGRADRVYEVVCGIPLLNKSKKNILNYQ